MQTHPPLPGAFWPSENYMLRLDRRVRPIIENTVIDMVSAGLDTVALVQWRDAAGLNGITLTRFDPSGAVVFQTPVTACGIPPPDCSGRWFMQDGALARMPGGFIMVASYRPASPVSQFVGAGFDDAGKLLWMRSYIRWGEVSGNAPLSVGIAPLEGDRFLIGMSAKGWKYATFFQIDHAGNVLGSGWRIVTANMARLRATRTQGIFAVGTMDDGTRQTGWILNIDPASGLPRWERLYTAPDVTGAAPRWLDIAEGDRSVVVVGKMAIDYGTDTEALIAGLDKDARAGEILWARSPRFEQMAHLYGIANQQFDLVPVKAEADVALEFRWSRFAVCGVLNRNTPWLFMIDDAGNVDWQKVFFHPPTTGTAGTVIWPSYEQIVVGGTTQNREGERHAFVASSKPVPRAASAVYCSRPVTADFPTRALFSADRTITTEGVGATVEEFTSVPGPPQPVIVGCPDQ